MNRKDINEALDQVERALTQPVFVKLVNEAVGGAEIAAARVNRLIKERKTYLAAKGLLNNHHEFIIGSTMFEAGDLDAALDWFETGNEHDLAVAVFAMRKAAQ